MLANGSECPERLHTRTDGRYANLNHLQIASIKLLMIDVNSENGKLQVMSYVRRNIACEQCAVEDR